MAQLTFGDEKDPRTIDHGGLLETVRFVANDLKRPAGHGRALRRAEEYIERRPVRIGTRFIVGKDD